MPFLASSAQERIHTLSPVVCICFPRSGIVSTHLVIEITEQRDVWLVVVAQPSRQAMAEGPNDDVTVPAGEAGPVRGTDMEMES